MEKQTKPDALDRALTDLYQTAVPEGYRARWRAAVQKEALTHMKKDTLSKPQTQRTLWRALLPAAAALVLVIGAITAGNVIPSIIDANAPEGGSLKTATQYSGTANAPVMAQRSYQAEEEYAWDAKESSVNDSAVMGMAMSGGADGGQMDSGADAQQKAKIVRTVDLTIASTAFDADTEALTALTESLGGYVASVSVSGEASARKDRAAYYSLRIPSDQLDAFLSGVNGIGRITARYETATDKSTQYADTTMRLTTQKEKMARLQQLLAQASDVSDLLEIENEIAATQYTLDSLESALRTIDRDVDHSAVSITVYEQSAGETAQAVELTLWQRIQSGFEASIKAFGGFTQNLIVFLAMALPVLVPIGVIVLALGLLRRAWRRRHGKSTSARNATQPPHGAAEEAPFEAGQDSGKDDTGIMQ